MSDEKIQLLVTRPEGMRKIDYAEGLSGILEDSVGISTDRNGIILTVPSAIVSDVTDKVRASGGTLIER